MTEIGKLKFLADECICMAYLLGGLALGMGLMIDPLAGMEDLQRIVGVASCVGAFVLVWLYDYARKKIRTIEAMESQDTEGGSL